jgi:hypothetical protein
VLLVVPAAAVIASAAAAPSAPVRTEQVELSRASGAAVVQGQLQGPEIFDYRVRAGAGQTLSVAMSASHVAAQFDLVPPDIEQASFLGHQSGRRYEGVIPTDGDYTLRVYLARPAARRDESVVYALHVALRGKALAPLPPGQDALLRGTPFHAAATVPCSHYLKTAVTECQAFVIRRVGDGNATVEVRWPDGGRRRVLFLNGMAVASDAPEPLSVQQVGDACQLRLGSSERFEIPEALVRGG